MTATTFLILSFAAYRGARAISIDSITQPIRDRLEMSSTRIGHWFDALIHCGFCTSFWTGGITYTVWAVVNHCDKPVLIQIINWWTIAGGANFLIALDTFLLREAPPK